MSDESPVDPIADRRLDESVEALREAAATEAPPPEVRRDTLHAIWAAEAEHYEASAARRSKLMRVLAAAAAVVLILSTGVVALTLVAWSWSQAREREAVKGVRPGWLTPATAPATAASTQAVIDAVGGAVVALGRVTFAGEPPAPQRFDLSGSPDCQRFHPNGLFDDSLIVSSEGGVANVVVSLRAGGDRSLTGPPPPPLAVLDQRGCRFVPRVLAVAVGQPILVKNSDPFLHNVHSMAVNNGNFNFGQPGVNPGTNVGPFTTAERFKIRCDVHPWMTVHVSVFEHPYFAVTGPDGSFAIPGSVPDGRYLLVAWHEVLGELQATIDVKGGSAVIHDFEFDPSAQPQ
jgi:hypothetical protein